LFEIHIDGKNSDTKIRYSKLQLFTLRIINGEEYKRKEVARPARIAMMKLFSTVSNKKEGLRPL